MGRGVSAGGGQSSLGYLFGGGESTNNPQAPQKQTSNTPQAPQNQVQNSNNVPPQNLATTSKQPVSDSKQTPAVAIENPDSKTNNYFRPDGQNCGNFITDRPSTKVHAAPGGGSSLGYLFGDGKK